MIVTAVIFLCIFTYIYSKYKLSFWDRRNVFTEVPFPLFGNLFNIVFRGEEFWSSLKKTYDKLGDYYPYYGFYIFHTPILILKDKTIIKQILVKDFKFFINRTPHANENVDPLISNTLFVLNNEVWRETRRTLIPIMKSRKMRQMLADMQETNNLKNSFGDAHDKTMDIQHLVREFIFDFLVKFTLGPDNKINHLVNCEISAKNEKMVDQVSIIRRLATFSWVFCPWLADIFHLPFIDKKNSDKFFDFYLRAENERRKQSSENDDVLDLMLKLSEKKYDKDIFEFDAVRRSAQAISFMGQGTDAITFGLSTCLYELALNPEVQNKLRNDIFQVSNTDGGISYESLLGIEYLDLVLKENMRLHPFLPFVTRYANADYKIKTTGLVIENGTQILIPTEAIHKDPLYYPEPLKFIPERFRGEKIRDELRYVYLPFGEGPRKCVAERMSWIVMKYGLVCFLKNYRVSLSKETVPLEIETNAIFASPKRGCLRLRVEEINREEISTEC